jgi:hypothetical protein
MRSLKLTAAFIAAAVALALTGAAASAAPRHANLPGGGGLPNHAHGCRLSLEFKLRFITVGEPADAVGQLFCGAGAKVGSQTVTIYERPATSSTFTTAATGTTEENGAYAIPIANVDTDSVFYAVADGVRSGERGERVIALVKLNGPPEGVLFTIPPHPGHRHPVAAVFTGEVSPADKGAIVTLQRQNALKGDEWHRIGPRGVVNEEGKFTIEHNFVVPGPANIRVIVRDPKVNVTSPSNILTYEITQAQNPHLTIESLADPISYGQSTTIHGAAEKLAPGTPLKLMARTIHTLGFTPVAEARVEMDGKYTFASQAPLASTFYKVLGGDESSALLYEGVKYLLTAGVLPGTTVEEGKPLVFSGTVKPGVAGHKIYLERENAAHTGFHVIATGEVIAPEPPTKPEFTYSIEYRFYLPGTTTVRVKIPGDQQNGSTVSEPFTIQVNAAPASTLVSAPPDIPTLPSEGQA